MKHLFSHTPSILTLDRLRLAETRNRSAALRAEPSTIEDVFTSGPDIRVRREFLYVR